MAEGSKIENIIIKNPPDIDVSYNVRGFHIGSELGATIKIEKVFVINDISRTNSIIPVYNCSDIKETNVTSNSKGFENCFNMKNNIVTGTSNKYVNCYSSKTTNATYLIPTAGSDTVNAGFNTWF